ncbi:MAG: hypothetical protein EA423_00480 [Phycisphaerales bacterium]|nr:MAG: hypothetical protein EA423_00480 [Phycisphaerales bacterium]
MLLMPVLALVSGCGSLGLPIVRTPAVSAEACEMFAPVVMRLHPLTHVDRTPAGQPIIVCHIEFADSWGDTVKAAGDLAVLLYRPRGATGATGTQELRWDIDLTDPETNAAHYDPATRTYRIQLGRLPEWATTVGQPGAEDQRIVLRAIFTATDREGRETTLRDELTVRG